MFLGVDVVEKSRRWPPKGFGRLREPPRASRGREDRTAEDLRGGPPRGRRAPPAYYADTHVTCTDTNLLQEGPRIEEAFIEPQEVPWRVTLKSKQFEGDRLGPRRGALSEFFAGPLGALPGPPTSSRRAPGGPQGGPQ